MHGHLSQRVLSKAVDPDRARHCCFKPFLTQPGGGGEASAFLGNKSLHLCDSQLKDIKSKRLISKSRGQWHFSICFMIEWVLSFLLFLPHLTFKMKSVYSYLSIISWKCSLISQVSTVKRNYIRLCYSLSMTCICFQLI